MKIPFGLYDFLGYTVPGLILIIIIAILIDPQLLTKLPDQLLDEKSKVAPFLRPTVIQGILYVTVCYLVGFVSYGLNDWLFGGLAEIFDSLKSYHSKYGMFESELFNSNSSSTSKKSESYTNQFVEKLKIKIEDVFDIEDRNAEGPVYYTEIFDLCRITVMKHSIGVYERDFPLLARYYSAKLMGSVVHTLI